MEDLTEKFDHLFRIISTEDFLTMKSLGGEIPFFITAYEPQQENQVRDSIRMLIKKLDTAGVTVLELNLYDIVCDLLEEKGGIGKMFLFEKSKSKDKFLRAIQSSLNIHEVLMPRIKKLIEESDARVYFLFKSRLKPSKAKPNAHR